MQMQVWLCHRYCRWPKVSHSIVPRLPCPTGEHSMVFQQVLVSLWEEKTEEMQISSCSFSLLHSNVPFFPGVFKTLFYFLLPFLCTGCSCNKSRMSCSRLCLSFTFLSSTGLLWLGQEGAGREKGSGQIPILMETNDKSLTQHLATN